jgi:hypothetical protein
VVPEVESAMFPRGASPVGEAFLVGEAFREVEFRPEVGVFLAAAAFPREEDRVPHGNGASWGDCNRALPRSHRVVVTGSADLCRSLCFFETTTL